MAKSKGTPKGQTDANQAFRADRGQASRGYDTSGTPRGQTYANHPNPTMRPKPASMVPSHHAQIPGGMPVKPKAIPPDDYPVQN